MQVSLSIAEYARGEADGTLTALHLGLQRFVILDPGAEEFQLFAYIVLLVTFGIEDSGSHVVQIVVVDEDGSNVIPEFRRDVTIAGRFTSETAIVPIAHPFPVGRYELRFLWDGESKAVYPIAVERGEDPGTASEGQGSPP